MSDTNNPPSSRPMTLRQQLKAKVLFMRNYNQVDNEGWNEALDDLEALCQEIAREARSTELETLRKSMRGEDPDQFRPRDMISMGLVEEIIDAHLAELTQKPPHYPNGRDEPCEICGDGGHTEIACPNQKPPQSKEQK